VIACACSFRGINFAFRVCISLFVFLAAGIPRLLKTFSSLGFVLFLFIELSLRHNKILQNKIIIQKLHKKNIIKCVDRKLARQTADLEVFSNFCLGSLYSMIKSSETFHKSHDRQRTVEIVTTKELPKIAGPILNQESQPKTFFCRCMVLSHLFFSIMIKGHGIKQNIRTNLKIFLEVTSPIRIATEQLK
jgi:hypothetical protein